MIDALARLLGIRRDQTEDALKSERAARATLNRRGFLLAGASASAALATGAIWSLPAVEAAEPVVISGAFLAAKAAEIDALYAEAARSLSLHVWGSQWGLVAGHSTTLKATLPVTQGATRSASP